MKRPPPKQLFAGSPQEAEALDRLACGFRCPYCASFGADVRETAAAAVGSPRLFETPNNFLAARCLHCSAVQLFDMEYLKRSPAVQWDRLAGG